MVVTPAVIALVFAALLGTAMILACAPFAVQVLRHWDLSSGAERQLVMERRTYLVSTVVSFVLAVELVSLLLFVFNADRMSLLFVGAMCAVGSLNANAWGFPALYLKIATFFAAALWLVLHHVDQQGWDYPLLKAKYAVLLALAPLMAASATALVRYFAGLEADVITSCCGSLFSNGAGVSEDLATLAPAAALYLFFGAVALASLAGLHAWRRGHGGPALAAAGAAAFGLGLVATVSAISVYVYEQPQHHCPFCLLKAEYGYFGYTFYVPLFAATALSLGAGAVGGFRRRESLRTVIPVVTRRLGGLAVALYLLAAAAAAHAVLASNLVLAEGGR